MSELLCWIGLHGWRFSHTSKEEFVYVNAGKWHGHGRNVQHYNCRYCGKWKAI